MKLLASVLVAFSLASAAQAQDAKSNIPYANPAHERQVLDIYAPPDARNLPVVFWIHGGGWQTGDKTSVQLKPRAFVALWKVSRIEAAISLGTFALTIASAPQIYWGVLGGLLAALAHYMYRHLHPRIIEVGLHPDGSLRDRHLWQLPPLAPRLYALRMDAELDFASATTLERAINTALAAHHDLTDVCLFAQPINRVDITGAEVFGSIRRALENKGVKLHISGLKLPAQQVLESAGLLSPGPLLFSYRTDAEALAALTGSDAASPWGPGAPAGAVSASR